jgi:uncharacterized protein (DUF1800 family)
MASRRERTGWMRRRGGSLVALAAALLCAASGASAQLAPESAAIAAPAAKITATPTFNPAPGSYVAPRTVAIASATAGAQIRYTLDGSSPTRKRGALYAGPITLNATVTLRAIAFSAGRKASFVQSGLYTITQPPPPPPPPPPGGNALLLVAALTPQSGALTLGGGNATLLLTTDKKRGAFRMSYGNLSGPLTGAHIHAPDGSIVFDLDATPAQPDGSRTWTIADAGAWTRAQIVAALDAGTCYVNLHTALYPSGEIKGFLRPGGGSVTFTPPPAPPALPTTPPTAAQAARFLRQGAYGPTLADIATVQSRGYAGWITDQMALPRASHLAYVDALPGDPEELPSEHARESIWKQAILGKDQLRQRVALALSELFVVSDRDDDLGGVEGIAVYMDVLERDAFASFRTLMGDVALSPAMGVYLDMLSNDRESEGRNPNENFGRELLQLFTIGLYQLHPDGTWKLGNDGLPVPTYDQETVQGFARVFTGWTFADQDTSEDWHFEWPEADWRQPMELWPEHHSTSAKKLLNGVVLPGSNTAEGELAAALDNVFQHPNVGPFVCRHLIQRLVTSNPSPAYVYRCGQVFANDGTGARGNLAAVVRAILLDWEARASEPLDQRGYGQVREPAVRFVSLLRALHAKPPADGRFRYYWLGGAEWGINQVPLSAPTVFNFFEPGYAQPGAIANAGLVSPEMQITNETSVFGTANYLGAVLFEGYADDDAYITLDWSELTSPSTDAALLDRVDLLFYAGRMSAQTRATFAAALADEDFPTDRTERAQTLVWLVALSPEFVAGP